ncbi:tyrosine-type recombinase/integrase [soil metagenome]
MTPPRKPPDFAKLVQDFFGDRLVNQQSVSPHTLAGYRDSFRLLLAYVGRRRRRSAAELVLNDLDAPMILAFLEDLESTRKNSVRTRNVRLAAVRAFMSYAASRDPTVLPVVQKVMAIPCKRFHRPLLGYLTRPEIEAILAAPNPKDWSGRRNKILFALMYNTGARVSEAIGWSRADVRSGQSASIRIHGKGRKDRAVPLWKTTAKLLANWFAEIPVDPGSPLFPNRFEGRLSRSGVEDRLQRAVTAASERCPSLRTKTVSPHTLRHTTAMHMLQAGVDVTVIALWLGHESPETTHQYVEADIEMKRRILDRLEEPDGKIPRRPKKDDLIDFLDQL